MGPMFSQGFDDEGEVPPVGKVMFWSPPLFPPRGIDPFVPDSAIS